MVYKKKMDTLRLRDGPISVVHLTPKRDMDEAERAKADAARRLYGVFERRRRGAAPARPHGIRP